MRDQRLTRPMAARQVPWGPTMAVAILLSVALLIAAGLDRPAESAPMRLPAAPAAEAQRADTERATEPAPAPAPQPGLIR